MPFDKIDLSLAFAAGALAGLTAALLWRVGPLADENESLADENESLRERLRGVAADIRDGVVALKVLNSCALRTTQDALETARQ